MAAADGTIGKYRLVRPLAEGGMGSVYEAKTEGPGGFSKEVALKVIHPQFAANPRFLEMFLREARALGALNHRNIVQVFDLGIVDDQPFLAMELLRGIDLHRLSSTLRTPMPWAIGAFIGAEVARGLHAAHTLASEFAPRGLVHGDFSPTNVVVCVDGAVKVLDFGISRPAGVELSSPIIMGKLPYLAPEVLIGEAPDAKVDIYAQGVVLHELLTRERLFRAENDARIMYRVLHDPVPAPAEVNPAVPVELSDVVMRAMSRDKGQRFATSLELAQALEPFIGSAAGTTLASMVTSALGSPRSAAAPMGRGAPDLSSPATTPASPAALASSEATVVTQPAAPRRTRRALIGAGVAAALVLAAWAAFSTADAPAPVPSTPVEAPPATPPAPEAVAPPPAELPAPAAPEAVEAAPPPPEARPRPPGPVKKRGAVKKSSAMSPVELVDPYGNGTRKR